MTAPRKLNRYITLHLAGLFLVMIVAYTSLVIFSVVGALDAASSYDLHLAARDFELLYRKDALAPLPQGPRLKSYIGKENLPDQIRVLLQSKKITHGKLTLLEDDTGLPKGFGFSMVFVFPYDLHDGRRLYLLKTYTEEDDIPETFKVVDQTPILLLVLGIGFILLFYLLVQALFGKVVNSVRVLSGWARGIDGKLLKDRPDFYFQEVDQLADIIEDAVTDLNLALTREHRFLRNASHELRTPIAVIQTSMDLLGLVAPDPGKEEKEIYRRIRRSAGDMHRLTETLLWLNRKKEEMPLSEPIRIHSLIDELVQENAYLLSGKSTEVSLETVPATINFPVVALRIALGNLIRNAFQHTDQGIVRISSSRGSVTVANTSESLNQADGDRSGFGLGLLLVQQICEKLNITYECRKTRGGHEAVLMWPRENGPADNENMF
ncbi:MAG: HAMP domain-containing histidine kinase [Desulfobacterales bacterium]|nr:HAMP domain-containing histidine kinase [Desulfobacterales bacterium]